MTSSSDESEEEDEDLGLPRGLGRSWGEARAPRSNGDEAAGDSDPDLHTSENWAHSIVVSGSHTYIAMFMSTYS